MPVLYNRSIQVPRDPPQAWLYPSTPGLSPRMAISQYPRTIPKDGCIPVPRDSPKAWLYPSTPRLSPRMAVYQYPRSHPQGCLFPWNTYIFQAFPHDACFLGLSQGPLSSSIPKYAYISRVLMNARTLGLSLVMHVSQVYS
jgi:hypothetical protein